MFHHLQITTKSLQQQKHNHVGHACNLPSGVILTLTTIDIMNNSLIPRGTKGYTSLISNKVKEDDTYLSWLQFKVMKTDTNDRLVQVLQQGDLKVFTDGSNIEYCLTGTAV